MRVLNGALSQVLVVVSVGAWVGCGERPDVLGPYVEQLRQVDGHNARLVEYRAHLKADHQEKAQDVRQTVEAYLADLESFGDSEDKRIFPGHNALKRGLQHALNKIVEPDFPTYTISALKQIELIEHSYNEHIANLKKHWEQEERAEAFPLAWPEEG